MATRTCAVSTETDESNCITINGNTIDLSPDNPTSASYISLDASHTNYIYIQGKQPLGSEEKKTLRDLHVQVQRYIGNKAHLCRYESRSLDQLRQLPFVQHVDRYHREFKISKPLKDFANRAADVDILVELHEGATNSVTEITEMIASLPSVKDCGVASTNQIQLTAPRSVWQKIELIDDVKTITRRSPITNLINHARVLLRLDAPTKDGTDRYSRGQRTLYDGAGQIITIADSGFDLGDENDVHPAFRRGSVILRALSRPGGADQPAEADDPGGHGTHVAGCAVGFGLLQVNGQPDIVVSGTAPGAGLIVQSIGCHDGRFEAKCGSAFTSTLLRPAYDLGSRIHNNSWGAGWHPEFGQAPYEEHGFAEAADNFVFHNPDFAMIVGAGNSGLLKDKNGNLALAHIGCIAGAKNVITVGASQSSRPTSDGTKHDSSVSAEMDTLAPCCFSSEGPTFEGRMKPDVVAPGNAILSARTRHKAHVSNEQQFGASPDGLYMFLSGTSMAAPLVAGCVAVVREALLAQGSYYSRFRKSPSAALIKALLVHYAVSMEGSRRICVPHGRPNEHDYNRTPDPAFGYGRVDALAVISAVEEQDNTQWSGFVDVQQKLAEGEKWSMFLVAPSLRWYHGRCKRLVLKITMVYLDPPGSSVQNRLVLSLVRGRDHVVLDSTEYDRPWEVVQQLFGEHEVDNYIDIVFRVDVTAHPPIGHPDQKFAVVWSWDRTNSDALVD